MIVLDDDDGLFHVSAYDTSTTNCDLDGLIKNSPGRMVRKRGTVHDRLPIWANIVENAHNLRFKTHVQHSISFIQDNVRYSSEMRRL
jgi:hypothetical protein